MDALTLLKIRDELRKEAQTTRAVILPQVAVTGTRRKKKLSPEAMEALEEMQRTPRDIFGRGPVGSAAQSAALGGAVGGGLGYLGTGITQTGLTATPVWRKGVGKAVAEEALPAAERAARKAVRSKLIHGAALAGAGAGLGSNVYYQAKKRGLQKKLEKALGIKPKSRKKEKRGEDLLYAAARVKAEQLNGR
jgi:hypothetical protein